MLRLPAAVQFLSPSSTTCNPLLSQALMLLATKPMQLATYFCTCVADNHLNWRHYALAMGHYTHFTSPIR
jgi:DIS3-like exonuclease 2